MSAFDQATIDALAEAVAQRMGTGSVPLELQLWSLQQCADYLGRHIETVRETMASLPSFPRAIRLPARPGKRGHALYNAGEVIKWAHSFKEKR